MADPDELQQKYAFLLKPIKDLTKNFEVDLFNVLEEYIGEMEKMEFALEDGKTLNFVEAAILIQGTACVWGRKVEYLHNLVGQTLNMLMNKKSAGDNDGDAAQNATDHESIDEDEVKWFSFNDKQNCNNERLPKFHDSDVKPLPLAATLTLDIDTHNRGTQLEQKSENDNIYFMRDFVSVCATAYHDHVCMLSADSNAKKYFLLKTSPIEILKTAVDLPEPEVSINNLKCMEQSLESQDDGGFQELDSDIINDSAGDNQMEIIEEHNVQNHGMQRREKKDNPSLHSSVEPEPLLLDEHVYSNEYYSRPLKKCKSARKKKRKSEPQSFMNILFETKPKSKHYGSDINHCIAALIETSKHGKQIAELRKNIRRQIRSNKNHSEENELLAYNADNPPDISDDDNYDDNNDDYMMGNIEIIENNQNSEIQNKITEPLTYEEIVQQNVRRFYEEALRYKQDNQLAKRVKLWEERVGPLLKEQNNRPEFDIHECGDKMVSTFEACGVEKLFTDCVSEIECKNDWEICRLFAATLQLANDGNFFISKTGDMNSMKLELLTKHRLRERLDSYD